MRWHLANRATPAARKIADGHYNRQKRGAAQFVPPGRCMVLVIPDVALWVTSWPFAEYTKHAWAGAWVNSTFRNERGREVLSSELIVEALAATRWFAQNEPSWRAQAEPDLGMVTFVDERKVRRKRDPGRCYTKAGFIQVMEEVDGKMVPVRTKDEGLLVFQMLPAAMPPPERPLGTNLDLFGGWLTTDQAAR